MNWINRLLRHSFVILIFLVSVPGCDRSNEDPSSDINALRKQLIIDTPASAVTWEIFGTPEYTGWLPAPTDYITLVAEFDNVPQSWIEKQGKRIYKAWVVPEAPRSWLSPNFNKLLKSEAGNVVALSNGAPCFEHGANVRRSGRPVKGFACYSGGRVLIYLVLSEPNS